MIELISAIALFALSSGITPGPNNILLLSSGANFGIKASLPLLLGICLGFPSMVLGVGLGLSVIFSQSPLLHLLIQYLGVSYLLFLAYKIWNSHKQVEQQQQSTPLSFIHAAAFQWINPKAWMMAITAVSMFTDINQAMTQQVSLIAFVIMLCAFPCAIIWLGFGKSMKHFLQQQQQRIWFNRIMAALLVGSIFPMLQV